MVFALPDVVKSLVGQKLRKGNRCFERLDLRALHLLNLK